MALLNTGLDRFGGHLTVAQMRREGEEGIAQQQVEVGRSTCIAPPCAHQTLQCRRPVVAVSSSGILARLA
jgi:hypothetical protein